MGRDSLKKPRFGQRPTWGWEKQYFCDDDFDPITGPPDEWTEEDQKKLDKR